MRVVIGCWILCVGIMCTGVTLAAPKVGACDQFKRAEELDDSGEYDKAPAAIDGGLAAAPKDLPLLGLKRTVLLEQRDCAAALAAYQAYLDTGAQGSTPCPSAPEANVLDQRRQSRALAANVTCGATSGAAITAAILWLTGSRESRVAVTPRLGAVSGLDLAVRY